MTDKLGQLWGITAEPITAPNTGNEHHGLELIPFLGANRVQSNVISSSYLETQEELLWKVERRSFILIPRA